MQTLERNSIVACGSSWRLILALASPLALMVPAVAVTDAFAGHAIAPESQVDWRTHLTTVDDAVGESDVPVAVLRWRDAYAAALRSRHWEGLVAVGDVYRRLGGLGGFKKAAEVKARTIYLAALFRARQEASLDGVLRAAEAFAELGDAPVVEQCLKLARPLASLRHRSEEHTSELQSRLHLVCRLLLEKKKKTTQQHIKQDKERQRDRQTL